MNDLIKLEEYDNLLSKIANNDQTLDDIKMLTSSKVTDQLKVFLVAQARRELSRVVVLTKFLDKLEDNFMRKVNDGIIDDSLTLKQYNDIINTITSLLSRSNEVISRVLKDDSLTTILNTTIYASDNTKTTSVVTSLKDAQSRERVRVMINQVINGLNNRNYKEDEIVEVNDNDQTEL